MNKYEIKRWIKEHKVEILVCGFNATMLGLAVVLGTKSCKSENSVLRTGSKFKDINVDLDTATVVSAEQVGNTVNLVLSNFKVRDIGKLGKSMIKNIPNVTDDTAASCLIGLFEVADKV